MTNDSATDHTSGSGHDPRVLPSPFDPTPSDAAGPIPPPTSALAIDQVDGDEPAFVTTDWPRLLSIHDIMAMPPIEWLVEGHLAAGSLAVLYGKEGSYKTFLALDLACSLATGIAWQGHATVRGPVLYVMAEGFGGVRKRLDAWAWAHGLDLGRDLQDFTIIDHAINLLDPAQVGRLIQAIIRLPDLPALVVFDTLARCMSGGDENSAKDMGQVIHQLDRIHDAVGSTQLVVHHSTKASSRAVRGSSALAGAADTVLAMTTTRTGDATLTCEEQKEAAPFRSQTLIPVPVRDSLILTGRPAEGDLDGPEVPIEVRDRVAIEALLHRSCGESLSKTAILDQVKGNKARVFAAIDEAAAAPESPVHATAETGAPRFRCACSQPTHP